MNLHPTDSGDRNTQDEAKHFHTVGFLFQICIQNGIHCEAIDSIQRI